MCSSIPKFLYLQNSPWKPSTHRFISDLGFIPYFPTSSTLRKTVLNTGFHLARGRPNLEEAIKSPKINSLWFTRSKLWFIEFLCIWHCNRHFKNVMWTTFPYHRHRTSSWSQGNLQLQFRGQGQAALRQATLVCRLCWSKNKSPKTQEEDDTPPPPPTLHSNSCLKDFRWRTCSTKRAITTDNYIITWTRYSRQEGTMQSLFD